MRAYTWFNRFVAPRFLEAKGWHRFATRVLHFRVRFHQAADIAFKPSSLVEHGGN
jgi:hypothetical protein